jgi:hypothetical protein
MSWPRCFLQPLTDLSVRGAFNKHLPSSDSNIFDRTGFAVTTSDGT